MNNRADGNYQTPFPNKFIYLHNTGSESYISPPWFTIFSPLCRLQNSLFASLHVAFRHISSEQTSMLGMFSLGQLVLCQLF